MRALPFLLAASCFGPAYEDCKNLCGMSGKCPEGMMCRADGYCVEPGSSATCSPPPDGPINDSQCGFGQLPPTNVGACTVPPTGGDWIVVGSFEYSTTTGVGDATSPGGMLVGQTVTGGPLVRVVHVATFRVSPGAVLMVTGDYPLVIQADTAEINGTIELLPTGAGSADCTTPLEGVYNATNGCGDGGGGGGYGMGGGVGGNCMGTSGGRMGAATGAMEISPLLVGCPGGQGGSSTGSGAGTGGYGGGALQISASMWITVTGAITAGGGAGGGGGVSGGTSAGGGGGGSGGSIFLEAPMVSTVAGSQLCANGGGGGEGASTNVGGAGAVGVCMSAAAGGGGGGTGGGDGGEGGWQSAEIGSPGEFGTAGGGGGGGGGVGRIRLRGNPVDVLGYTSPLPYITPE